MVCLCKRRRARAASALSIGLVAVLTSCAALDASVRRGDSLAEEGRWHEAMLEYEDAAERSPRSSAIQERLQTAREHVAADLAALVDGALETRRMDRAEQFLQDALDLAPESPRVIEARRNVAGAWAKEAEALLEEDEDVDRAFRAVERARQIDSDGPGVRTARNRIRAAYVESLREEADAFEQAGRAAPALVALVRLAGVDRADLQTRQRMTELRSWMQSQAGYTVEVRQLRAPRRLRTAAAEMVERLLALQAPEGCPNLHLTQQAIEGPGSIVSGELSGHAFEASERKRTESHTYQSGTREVPNPEWPQRKADVEHAEQDLNDALEEVQRLMEEVSRREVLVVESGPADDVASRRRDLEAAREDLADAREEVQGASAHLAEMRDKLNQTPETLDEPVMTDEDLVITEVTRTFRVEVLLDARDIATGDTQWERRLYAAESKTDAEHHEGILPADIEPKPLEIPMTDEQLRDQALEELFAEVRDDLGDLCAAHREALRQNGLSMAAIDDMATATEWFVLGLFYDPEGDLDEWDRDGRVQRFFRQEWQIDDPMTIVDD